MTAGCRRLNPIAAIVATVTLTAGLATGCEFDESLDCLSNADTVADSIAAIQRAGADASEDPTRTEESIATIEKNLDKIDDSTDDSKVGHAVDDLDKAITDYNRAVLRGDSTPDADRIDAAAARLKDVCTP